MIICKNNELITQVSNENSFLINLAVLSVRFNPKFKIHIKDAVTLLEHHRKFHVPFLYKLVFYHLIAIYYKMLIVITTPDLNYNE